MGEKQDPRVLSAGASARTRKKGDVQPTGENVNNRGDGTVADLVDDVQRHLARCRRLRQAESRPTLPRVARGRDRGRIQVWRPGEQRTFEPRRQRHSA
jgi:hypothetical protein